MIMAIIDIIPTLNKFPFLFSYVDRLLSMNDEVTIPMNINKNDNVMTFNPEYLLFNNVIDSGTKSVIDTQIITPAAKERLAHIILSVFFNLIKIIIRPNKVDSPARKVNKKAICVLDIIITNKVYEKKLVKLY